MAFVDLTSVPFQVEWFGAACAFVVFWVVIAILIAVWVYRDAESRGMNGVLWLIVVILLGLIGLIVYLIVRTDRPPMGAGYPYGYPPPGTYPYAQPPAAGAPPQAPAPAAAPPTNCKSCGAPLSPNVSFCANCGTKV